MTEPSSDPSPRPSILEDLEGWGAGYDAGWLAHYQSTGTFDWKQYPRPQNGPVPPSPGVDIAKARLIVISTAGAYDPATQAPFDAAHPLGDYTLRELPFDLDLATLAFAHDHYDHTARQQDPGVLLPHHLLRERVAQGAVGGVAPTWISFMGYQPDIRRVALELAPRAVEVALREQADAALLVPS